MAAYYNEHDPYAAQWLRNLIAAGHIAAGEVDERSIVDVKADDLRGYEQCHFFAGIGVWSYALRRAGWPDDRPVWTGSCPCQPFSAAGKGEGTDDARHLWPEWFRLIREHRPVAIFGEQVGAAIRHGWLDLVQADLEGLDYALGAAVVGAHSVGAPHIRQRLFFVGHALGAARERNAGEVPATQAGLDGARIAVDGSLPVGLGNAGPGVGTVADASIQRREDGPPKSRSERPMAASGESRERVVYSGESGELADADGGNPGAERQQRGGEHGQQQEDGCSGVAQGDADDAGPQGRRVQSGERAGELAARQAGSADGVAHDETGRRSEVDSFAGRRDEGTGAQGGKRLECGDGTSFWSACDWLPCIDGKARPVEPGTFPLAHGATARVGRLRAYGNAIVAPIAEEFIRAYLSR